MNINKELKSIVITYTDEECVRLTGVEAERFRHLFSSMYSAYLLTVLKEDVKVPFDLGSYFNYETIRHSMYEDK